MSLVTTTALLLALFAPISDEEAALNPGDLLTETLSQLARSPTDQALRQEALRQIASLEATLDKYFHQQTKDRRDVWLALRPQAHGLFVGPKPVFAVSHDLTLLRPEHQEVLAAAALAQGCPAEAAAHLRQALFVVGPERRLLSLLIQAEQQAGNHEAVAELKRFMEALVDRP